MRTIHLPFYRQLAAHLLGSALLSQFTGPAPERADVALDVDVQVGPTTTIRSQYEGLPLVEPHISAHPTRAEHLLVAAMVVTDIERAYESSRLTSFVSHDAGATWKETTHDWWGYDPWTAIGDDDATVMAWIGNQGEFQHTFPIRFFSSTSGGNSWSAGVQELSGNHDGTKLVAHGSRFYFTSVRLRSPSGADVVLYRRDGDAPFEQVARIDGEGARLNFCEPAVLSDGSALVPASLFLRNVWVQRYDPRSGTLHERRYISSRPAGNRGYMRMVADNSADSAYTDQVYFVRALQADDAVLGIWLNVSPDGGNTWSSDRRIDLFEQRERVSALVPSIATNADGVVGVSWVDGQRSDERILYDVYFAASVDGGASFSRPQRVTEVSTSPRTKGNSDVANKFPGGGHYLGLAAKADGSFQLVWSDSRSGIFELQTSNVRVAERQPEASEE